MTGRLIQAALGNWNVIFVHHFHFHFIGFRSGQTPILIATDVASRGLGLSLNTFCKQACSNNTRLYEFKK